MDARARAIEAITKITIEGPIRERAIRAVGQISTNGVPFKLFLDGTKRQNDHTIRVLKESGAIEPFTKAKPGVKATYVAAEDFRDSDTHSAALVRDIIGSRSEVASSWQDAHLIGIAFESFSDAYPTISQLDEIEESWKSPAAAEHDRLVAAASAKGVSFDGTIGDAADTVLWTIASMGSPSFADFPNEGRSHRYGERTLRSAIKQLRDAGIIEVIRGRVALYMAIV